MLYSITGIRLKTLNKIPNDIFKNLITLTNNYFKEVKK